MEEIAKLPQPDPPVLAVRRLQLRRLRFVLGLLEVPCPGRIGHDVDTELASPQGSS